MSVLGRRKSSHKVSQDGRSQTSDQSLPHSNTNQNSSIIKSRRNQKSQSKKMTSLNRHESATNRRKFKDFNDEKHSSMVVDGAKPRIGRRANLLGKSMTIGNNKSKHPSAIAAMRSHLNLPSYGNTKDDLSNSD